MDSAVLRFGLITFGFLLAASGTFAQSVSPADAVQLATSQIASERFEDWQYRCVLPQQSDQAPACELSQSAQVEQDGSPVEVLNIALSRADDAAGNVGWALVILTPQDVHLPSDFGLTLGAATPQIVRYRNCNQAGCWVVIPADEQVLGGMKRGLEGAANFRLLDGQVVRVVFSLRGFTRGFAALSNGDIIGDGQ